MSKLWQVIRGYIWWTHPRGNIHYDVMVTLILAFIFLTPTWVFKDKPTVRVPHQTEVVVSPDGENFIYQVDAAAVPAKEEAAVRKQLLQIIEPISGEAEITRVEATRDARGQVKSYKVWVERPYR